MRQKISQSVEIPEGITCTFTESKLVCKSNDVTLEKEIKIPRVKVEITENKITLESEKGNKNDFKKINAYIAHIKNIFRGLKEEFTYTMEAANIHFPMTFKVEGEKMVIGNFLGEKVPRVAKIVPNVKVEVKGQVITVSSHDREAAGQTAANIEKATRVNNRDRRIFQDGIYITEKPQRQFQEVTQNA